MNNISKEKPLARELLYSWIELLGLTPKYDQWNYDYLSDNPPRLIRLQRIQSLFRALRINCKLKSFSSGEFIFNKLELYKDYDTSIFNKIISNEGENSSFSYEYLPEIFEQLFSFRMKISKPLAFNDGLLSIGEQTMYSYMVTSYITSSIKSLIKPLDELLIMLIDPIGYQYTEEELIQYYDYPIDDLNEIDIEWM